MYKAVSRLGFTLIELIVVITILSILAAVLYGNFNEARKSSRDEARKASLQELQVALELYKAQYGRYPEQGCGEPRGSGNSGPAWAGPGPIPAGWGESCSEYIVDLAPEFIPQLPTDPKFKDVNNKGYIYSTNVDGTAYKVLSHQAAEIQLIEDPADEFSRCPEDVGSGYCGEGDNLQPNTYGVYSAGAEAW